MPDSRQPIAPHGPTPDRIDLISDASIALWCEKLGVTESQLKEAVMQVGDRATDVEMHLKGSRSLTNKERTGRARW